MRTTSDDTPELPTSRKLTVLASVILATTLYSTTLLVVSTILPQMQGSFSATSDEIAWSMTFNILATAIVTPMTGWLAARFGVRRVMVGSMAGFTAATLLCATADSLEVLILARIIQGAFGAPTTPLSQSILLETFPVRQHAIVLGLYGFGVVIGPVIGPILGGIMAETYTWRWAFYILVPVGLVSIAALRWALPTDRDSPRAGLDWVGFIALSLSLTAAQYVLSRGQRLDWLDSTEIIISLIVAGVTFWIFATHCLTTTTPFLNPRLLLNRNYAIGLALVMIYGMLNFTPMVLLPPLLTTQAGYTDSLVGLVVAGRGAGGCVGFLFAGLVSRMDARLSICCGFSMLLTAGLWLTSIDLNIGAGELMANAALQGLAIGLIWVPLTTTAFATIEKNDMAQATAVYHLMRNMGSSLFIAICVAEVMRSTGANYSRMTEFVSPFSNAFNGSQAALGFEVGDARGLARMSREIYRQASLIAYVNAFGLFTMACAATLPMVLLMRKKTRY